MGDDPLWELPDLTDSGSLSDEASRPGMAPEALEVALEAADVNPLMPFEAERTLGDVVETTLGATGADSMLPQEVAGDEPHRLWQQPMTRQPSDGLRGQINGPPKPLEMIQLDDAWQQIAPAFVK